MSDQTGIWNDEIADNNIDTRYIGTLTLEEREEKVMKYHEKKKRRKAGNFVRYECRKDLAKGRFRYQGRFIKAEDLDKLPKEFIYDPNNIPIKKPDNEPKPIFIVEVDEEKKKEREFLRSLHQAEPSQLLSECQSDENTDYYGIQMNAGVSLGGGHICAIDTEMLRNDEGEIEMCDPDFK
jgi:hypothetical protein